VWPAASARAADTKTAGPAATADELLVGFKHGATRTQRDAALARVDAHVKTRIRQIDAALVAVAHGKKADAMARLKRQPGIRYAEPNFELRASRLPSDPGFPSEWGLRNTGQLINLVAGTPGADIGAAQAWDVTTGSAGVAVGVIDSGIDVNHPDLAENIWLNPGENCPGCRTDGIDNDGNGYVDDWRGWDFASDDNDPSDDNGHGTHVAGTIGALGDNGIGVAGVNWNVRLMALKFIGADGSGTTADAIRALLYATDEGAAVTNNSYGGDGFSQAFADAIAYADRARSLFVAAAGNSSASNDKSPQYPASYDVPNVVAVAATDSSDNRAWFSNYGVKSVDLGAPGDNVYSTVPNGGYDFMSGTSMASPHVAGAAALAKAAFPSATGIGLKTLLLRTADPTPSLANVTTSGARLDAGNAVHCAGAAQAWIESPAPGFVATVGDSVPVAVAGAGCGDPAAAVVTASANGAPVALTPRGDGLYTGTFTADQPGSLSVTASAVAAGGSDTRTVSGTVPVPIVPGGAPVTVTAAAAGDNPLLAFRGTAGERISLALSGVTIGTSSCCGAKVSIVNPDGSALVQPAYFGTTGSFVDPKTLAQDGIYSIVVDPQASATGSATLTLYDVPADVTATIVPGGPQVNLPSTTVPGQRLKATFGGSAGRRISLRVGPLPTGTKVSIINPDGTTLVPAVSAGTSGAFVDTKALPQSGTYTVLVDPPGGTTTGASLTLYDVPPDAAAAIVPGGPQVSLTTSVPGQNAKATFDGISGRRVSLSIGAGCCSTKFSIVGPDGSALVPATSIAASGGFIDPKTLPQSGTYTIVVDPQATATGATPLRLYDVPAAVTAAITPGGPAVTLPPTTVPGQNATATFDGVAGQRVSLSLGPSCCSTRVSILDPDGATLVAPTLMGTSGFIDTKILPKTGTYTIVLDYQSASTGALTLTLNDVPADVTGSLVLGGPPLTVSITTPGQNAAPSFAGSAGRTITLQISAVTISSSKVGIKRPDGSYLVSPVLVYSTGKTLTAQLPVDGSYTVAIDPQGPNVGRMTLTLS
jgi:subtilisin family serine protease